MSSQPGSRLLNLAPEIVEQIVKQLSNNKQDLSNARLACKTMDNHATKELFRNILISPLEEHLDNWNSTSQDHVMRYVPRHATIHTQPDIEDHGLGHYREYKEIGDDFESALATLSRFPNLDSVTIGFTPECVGTGKKYWQEVGEDIEQRQNMLELIFQAIKDRAADAKNRAIRKLTIINLQNCPIPGFTSSALFGDVMSNLEELHVSFIHEFNEHGPDHDYTRIELQEFPMYFCSDWLQPIAVNLKALSIYHPNENWGPFPGHFNPSGISFPKLERLALGYYTFAHDNDLDWILAIKSLRTLVLHNCMIASWIRIGHKNMDQWKVLTHDWTRLPNSRARTWCDEFAYNGKWSMYLDRIAEALPRLRDFRFDKGSVYIPDEDESPYGVEHRESCGVRIFPQRYICFDNGILPTHWPEAKDDGSMHSWLQGGFPENLHEKNLEADQKSLERLLNKLNSS